MIERRKRTFAPDMRQVIAPEESGKIPPGYFALEEMGTIVWSGTWEQLNGRPELRSTKWFDEYGNRYLKGVAQ